MPIGCSVPIKVYDGGPVSWMSMSLSKKRSPGLRTNIQTSAEHFQWALTQCLSNQLVTQLATNNYILADSQSLTVEKGHSIE